MNATFATLTGSHFEKHEKTKENIRKPMKTIVNNAVLIF